MRRNPPPRPHRVPPNGRIPAATRPRRPGGPCPGLMRLPAPVAPGSARAMPPPLPAARAPFPAAAIALGVAGADRKTAPHREPTARAPIAKAPSAITPASAAPPRLEPHFESDPPMADTGEAPHEAPGGLVDPRAQDIAIMQSLIKGLADQLNAPTAPPLASAAAIHDVPALPGDVRRHARRRACGSVSP